jgi:DNA-binding beta-propeller fold protein YncE
VTLSGLPAGVSVSPSSPFYVTTAGQALTFTIGPGVANGTYALTFQATCGTLSASASASLEVAPPASFSVALSNSSLTVQYGSSVSTTINFSPGPGPTNYMLQLAAAGMPDGVTASFSPNPVAPTATATVTFATPSSAQASASAQITITATRSSDGMQQQAQLLLSMVLPPGQLPSSRTEFVRTDDTPSSVVYDSVHGLVFACESHLSRVDVISPSSRSIVKSIPLPGAQGLSLTPDNSQVFVSGSMQQVAWIDTASLAVVKRAILPMDQPNCPCAPEFVSVPIPAVTSSGRVLFLGNTPFYFGALDWNPSTGTIVERPDANVGQGGLMARSADATKIILSDDSTGGVVTLYDAATDSFPFTRHFNDFAFALAANPTGTQFAVAVAGQFIYILDAHLNTLGTAPAGGSITGMVYSPDGSQLYIVGQPNNVPIISTVNTQTLQLVGTAPAYASAIAYFSRFPPLAIETPMAADGTGLVFGAADHGLALDDSTFYQTFTTSAVAPASAIIATPAEGPVNSSTQVQIKTQAFNQLPNVWFGEQLGTNATLNAAQVEATAPPAATPGPVNIRIFDPDGTVAMIPQAFTYGDWPVNYGSLGAAPGGGPVADLFGYGYGVDIQGTTPQVQIGGNSAPVTHATLYPQESAYPFPLQHLQVTIPAGSAGAQDITVTSPSGATTISKGFHYLESAQDYSTSDQLLDVVYDQTRQRLYLSAGNHVDVFSLTTNTFQAPITPPSLGGKFQLGGMALTPDGSKLLVANFSDDSVAIINPDNPSNARAVQIVPSGTNPVEAPMYVVTTSLNTAFIGCTPEGVVIADIYQLDLATLQSSLQGPYLQGIAIGGNAISSSKDGSIVFVSQDYSANGTVALWNAMENAWQVRYLVGFINYSAVSGDGNVLSAVGPPTPGFEIMTFLDAQDNVVGAVGYPEFLYAGYISGERLHDSGSLDYFPSQQGIDVFDVNHGDLRERILLTEQLLPNPVHPMAIDETGQRIFLITNKGLTIAQLDSVPLSIGSVTPASGAAGTQIKIRGSGFVQGATASANGTAAAVSYVDADTLQVTLPTLPAGAVQITITNPDGQSYTLDDAFTVQ